VTGPARLLDPNRPLGTARAFLPYRPYDVTPTIRMTVARCIVDGRDVTREGVSEERCRLRPHVVGEWRDLQAELVVEDVFERLKSECFPGVAAPKLAMVGRAWCVDARRRFPFRFERRDATSLAATLRIRREDVVGPTKLDAFAVREDRDPAAPADVARRQFARVAQTPQWVVEETEADAVASGALEATYVDFSRPEAAGVYGGEDADALRAASDALCHVVYRSSGPLILINGRLPELRDVLLAKGTVGVKARLRDVLIRQIAATTWRSLLVEAAFVARETIGEDGAVEDWLETHENHWSCQVLLRAAREGAAKDDPVAGVRRALDELTDGMSRPGALLRLAENIASTSRDPLRALLEEVART
jgi:hypothetical protein